jgi:hypothetical protein
MFLPQVVVSSPITLEPVTLLERWLVALCLCCFFVYHANSFICRLFGVREDWLKLLIKSIMKNRKPTIS